MLPATHSRIICYLPLLHSRKALPLFSWYSLRLPTKGWPGWVDLGGWIHIDINIPHRQLSQNTVTHPSTNRVRRRLTSLIEANAPPLRQTSTKRLPKRPAVWSELSRHTVQSVVRASAQCYQKSSQWVMPVVDRPPQTIPTIKVVSHCCTIAAETLRRSHRYTVEMCRLWNSLNIQVSMRMMSEISQ